MTRTFGVSLGLLAFAWAGVVAAQPAPPPDPGEQPVEPGEPTEPPGEPGAEGDPGEPPPPPTAPPAQPGSQPGQPQPGYPQQGQGYPQQGYPQQGQGYPPQGQGYPPQGQGYPPQGQGYPPQGQPPPGQQGYPAYPYPPGQAPNPPPPPPPLPNRGAHLHDGFYLRINVGGGALSSEVSYDTDNLRDFNVSGGGTALDLLIGGSPADGLVIGGGIVSNTAPDPTVDAGGQEFSGERPAGLGIVGVFVDGFIDPEGGFNLGGLIGAANASFDDGDPGTDDEAQSTGLGVAAWVGYTAWVGEEWSLGGQLRLSAATTSADGKIEGAISTEEFTEEASLRSFALLFSILYH